MKKEQKKGAKLSRKPKYKKPHLVRHGSLKAMALCG